MIKTFIMAAMMLMNCCTTQLDTVESTQKEIIYETENVEIEERVSEPKYIDNEYIMNLEYNSRENIY